MTDYGIVIVSHQKDIAKGIVALIREVAKDVAITYVGGTEDGGIGTSFEQVSAAISQNPKNKLLAFFDLGSAKMNLEIAIEMSDKQVELMLVPILEGSYTAAALLQANAAIDMIKSELSEMTLNK
ncbi:PTS-dependent dihydroxyacetone kinase phosphotransferase subunit DhaM [Lactococcus piscium]|uniref:dihydroxyacetone kinase phosphoryl donor subunit DhaM n=1 Tax=Pseudolactococcus carnosus TaxID=2749961 RepID=UPI001FBB37A2|nr:dihydroxyacetone kinase phosphoryl donor subunit DhaM [Lactococcus carnosus]MCJ1982239.1 PTS-dependent dihydroxyacetone kinase phosphotransferase subunit DhaM [Lactococcus carnosus]MCJ1992119.1 PTS-dependent dihydroxyacetone kinase phosphotransferase subunit DhaM [Lactococcus carnosus]